MYLGVNMQRALFIQDNQEVDYGYSIWDYHEPGPYQTVVSFFAEGYLHIFVSRLFRI